MADIKLLPKPSPLKAEQVQRGLRVELCARGKQPRLGLMTGLIDRTYPRPRVEVIPEGLALSRLELWAMDDLVLLPKRRQLVGMGGGWRCPKGYPLVNKESGHINRS
jgi:hypothetical protein